jgi:superfamily II DNA/RNA helicase
VLPFLSSQQPLQLPTSRKPPHAVLVQSPTGTGKSLAFLLPVVKDTLEAEAERRRRKSEKRDAIRTIIVCPTQELAMQTEAQLRTLLAADPITAADQTVLSMVLGGPDSPDLLRASLLAHRPSIIVGTPRRLNSVLFPEYETHGQKEAGEKRIVVEDPEEDDEHVEPGSIIGEDGLPALDETEAAELRDQGRGESHGRPDRYSAAAAAAKAAQELLQSQQNSSIVSVGPSHQPLQPLDEEDALPPDATEQEWRDAKDERDGIRTDQLPPVYAQGHAGQRFLRTPHRLARQRVRTPLKKILRGLKFLVIDEADAILQPMRPHASEKAWRRRDTHPRPGQILCKALLMLNGKVQLIAASATVDGLLKKLLWNLGFDSGMEMIRIAPRLSLQTRPTDGSAGANEIRTDEKKLLGEQSSSQVSSNSNALTSPPPSALTPSFQSTNGLSIFHECPPNLSHFLVRCPSVGAWKKGTWWKEEEGHPSHRGEKMTRKRYDYFAPEAERQAVHEHNTRAMLALRTDGFIVDKIAALKVLLGHFKPKAPMLVVDESLHKRRAIEDLCKQVGLRPFVLHQALSSPDPNARQQLVQDLESGAVDLLLVQEHALRGIDFPLCDLVILLSVPRDSSSYLHAAGRTGRMGAEGSVMTLIDAADDTLWDGLVKGMPMTLTTAKQITLPRTIEPDLQERILTLYEQTLPERRHRDRNLSISMQAQLKKRVKPDPSSPRRHGGDRRESKTNQFIRQSLQVVEENDEEQTAERI